MAERIIVGEEGATFNEIVDEIFSSTVISSLCQDWTLLAMKLDHPHLAVQNMSKTLQLETKTHDIIFIELLTHWKNRNMSQATLDKLCGHLRAMGMNAIADQLLQRFVSVSSNPQRKNTSVTKQPKKESRVIVTNIEGPNSSSHTNSGQTAGPDKHQEDSNAFWTTPDVQSVGDTILVKRFKNASDDNVHIMRLNKDYAGSKFKFPSYFLSTLVDRMKAVLGQLELGEDNKWKLKGCQSISSLKVLTTDEFWTGHTCIKIVKFRIKPYVSPYGTLQFRLWQQVDEDQCKTFEGADGSKTWRGPATSLGVAVMKRLVTTLEKLQPRTFFTM